MLVKNAIKFVLLSFILFVPSTLFAQQSNSFKVVLDAGHLLKEIKELEDGGLEVRNRLKVSPGCPLILDYHVRLDVARELKRGADKKIGTTGKGIGPTYEDKVARRALRLYDLFYPDQFGEKSAVGSSMNEYLSAGDGAENPDLQDDDDDDNT